MKRASMFLMLLALWLLLVWPLFGNRPACGQDILVGIIVAGMVVLIVQRATMDEFGFWLDPSRYMWFGAYAVVLAYHVMKANLDVAYRLLHPAMPINPGIVKVKTTLRNPRAITVLANAITLTPGTLTVSATEDGVLYVHWINVTTTDTEKATKLIVSRFEWFIEKIFEK